MTTLHIAAVGVLLVAGCADSPKPQTIVPSPTHHWLHVDKEHGAYPYDERYLWVEDKTGRTDDCEIRQESHFNWSIYVRGEGFGEFETLDQAKQQCYRIAKMKDLGE
jgi:hypothetical protein